MNCLTYYFRIVKDFAWFNEGDIFVIAKVAKKLGRDYMRDISEFKLSVLRAPGSLSNLNKE